MLGEQLLELRKKSKLTQAALSARLKIARTTYSGYELGTSEPDNDTLEKIADYYGVTTDHLLGREPKEISTEETESQAKRRLAKDLLSKIKPEKLEHTLFLLEQLNKE